MKKTPKEWIRGPADEKAIANGCYFDIDAANHARQFFEQFLYVAPGKPFKLYDWQWENVIAPLFGWKRKDGTRRFRYAWIEIPKKNGKSLLASGIALYMAVADGEYNAQVFNAAWSREQAGVVFRECASMVRNSPELKKHLQVIDSTKRVIFKQQSSFIHSLSREAASSEGLNAHAVVCDEIHAWGGRALLDSLRYSGAARKQPLFLIITTAGDDLASFAYDLHKQAKGIIEGTWEDESFYAYIAAADDNDDWTDPAVWRKANPSLGLSLDPEQFKIEFEHAQKFTSQEQVFRRYRLNQWRKTGDKAWLKIDEWDKCLPRLSPEELIGRQCWAGLDLSSTSDLSALVLAFPDDDGGFHLLPYFWVPLDTAFEREKRGEAPYATWIKQGWIEGTPGNAIDYQFIRQRIDQLANQHGIAEIALDRAWQGQALYTELTADGHNVHAFGQGHYSMGIPAKQFEVLVKTGKLRHGQNPVLRWNSTNCVIAQDPAGNIKPDKARSQEKIDGIVAAIMAVGRASIQAGNGGSIYETQDLLVI